MRRALPILTPLAVVIAAGIVQGQWTQRWAHSHAVGDAVERLNRVPLNVGGWRGHPVEIGREQLAVAEIDGHVARRYDAPNGKDAVTVLLVCGRPGPISCHTPDVCYSGAGYEPVGPQAASPLSVRGAGGPAEFRHAVLGKEASAVPTYLRILWSWSAAGPWQAPDNPRLAFASRQALYKLYVIRELSTPEEPVEGDPGLEFLKALLPDLERAFFAKP